MHTRAETGRQRVCPQDESTWGFMLYPCTREAGAGVSLISSSLHSEFQVIQKLPVCWARLPGKRGRSVGVPGEIKTVLEKIHIFSVKDSKDRNAQKTDGHL